MQVFTLPLGALQTNCYILASEKKALVIDPADAHFQILAFLQKEGLTLEGILLTHCHFDHMGGVDALAEASGAPLFCPEKDAVGLTDENRNASRCFGEGLSIKTAPARLLKEGDRIELGNEELTVLETPGHTAGSVCYLADDLLISGDTLFFRGYGRTDLPSGSDVMLVRSLRRLFCLEDRTVYPGHGPSTTILKEKNFYGL